MSSRPRSFLTITEDDVERLEHRQYAKRTQYGMASAEKTFMAFLRSKNMDIIPADKKVLDSVLKDMWPSLQTTKKEPYHASSLISIRNMLRLVINEKVGVDIISDSEMTRHNTVFENHLRQGGIHR